MTTGPEHQNGQTVCAFAAAFLAAMHEVSLFLMDDGIYHVVKKHQMGAAAQLETLLLKTDRMAVSICTQSTEKRGVSETEALSRVNWASQHELAKIVSTSDRFLFFGH